MAKYAQLVPTGLPGGVLVTIKDPAGRQVANIYPEPDAQAPNNRAVYSSATGGLNPAVYLPNGTYTVAWSGGSQTVTVSGAAGEPPAAAYVDQATQAELDAAGVAASGTYISVGATHVDAANHGDDIAASIAALPSGGGIVHLNKPSYALTTGISTTVPNLEIVGAGGSGQDNTVGYGATQILVPAGVIGLQFNAAATSSVYQGPTLRRLHFRDPSGTATGGVRFDRTQNFLMEDVTLSDFAAGYGFFSNGGALSQYGELRNLRVANCLTGVDLLDTGGVRIFGGMFDGNSNNGTPRASATGLKVRGASAVLRCFGTVFQYHARLVDVAVSADLAEFFGCRWEGWTTDALRIAANNCQVFGGSVNNSVSGSGGTGINVLAGATDTHLFPSQVIACATPIADAGTDTYYVKGKLFQFPANSTLQIAPGAYLSSTGNSAYLGGSNGMIMDRSLTTGNSDYSAGVYLGGAQDTHIHRVGAGIAGGVLFQDASYTTAGRPSAATVGAGTVIYDTTLHKPTWSDGTNWRDSAGTIV